MSDESSSDSEKFDDAQSCGTASTVSAVPSAPYVGRLPEPFPLSFKRQSHQDTNLRKRSTSALPQRWAPTPSFRFYYNSDPMETLPESHDNSPRDNEKKSRDIQNSYETVATLPWPSSSESSLDIFALSYSTTESGEKDDNTITYKQEANLPHRLKKTDDTNTVDKPSSSTPRKEYQKLWEEANLNTKQGIILLLNDYTKGSKTILSNLSLLMHGHTKRPFIKEVRGLLQKADSMSALEIVQTLQDILTKHKHNPQCSLQKRLDFIKSQAPDLFTTTTPSPGL